MKTPAQHAASNSNSAADSAKPVQPAQTSPKPATQEPAVKAPAAPTPAKEAASSKSRSIFRKANS